MFIIDNELLVYSRLISTIFQCREQCYREANC